MTLFAEFETQTGATFSGCRTWRYQLWRMWDKEKPYLNVIGLNPSTADESKNDPTIRRCIGFAKSWGYGGLYVTNLFAYRATKPKDMKRANNPVGTENDRWIQETAENAGLVIAAWGENGSYLGRSLEVEAMVSNLHVFRLTPKSCVPEHPLYLPGDLKPKTIGDARMERADELSRFAVSSLELKIKEMADNSNNPQLSADLNRILSDRNA